MCVLLALSMLLFAAGCGETASQPNAAAATPEADQVDVDLTLLSSTMVYSEVYAMMYETESYMGKTVKMKGLYSPFESAGKQYHACIVEDATACCAQGLEFELLGSYVYPDDYPQPGTEITVVGTFGVYQEEYNGSSYTFLLLRDARLL